MRKYLVIGLSLLAITAIGFTPKFISESEVVIGNSTSFDIRTKSGTAIWRFDETNGLTQSLDSGATFDGVAGSSDEIVAALSPVSDFQPWTPTGSLSTNVTYTGMYRQDGDSIEGYVFISFSGGNDEGVVLIDLPSGLSFDTDKAVDAGFDGITIGAARFDDSSSGVIQVGSVHINSSTNMRVTVHTKNNGTTDGVVHESVNTANNPFDFSTNDSIAISFKAPIVGWTSGTDAVVKKRKPLYVRAEGNSGQSLSSQVTVTYSTEIEDNYNAFNHTTGELTCPYDGSFVVEYQHQSDTTVSAGDRFISEIKLEGSRKQVTVSEAQSTGGNFFFTNPGKKTIDCLEGEVIRTDAVFAGGDSMKASTSEVFIEIKEKLDSNVTVSPFGKCQTKYLSANVTTNTTGIADLGFNNLEIGKMYNLKIQAKGQRNISGEDNWSLICKNSGASDGDTLAVTEFSANRSSTTRSYIFTSMSREWTAGSTSVTCDISSISSGSSIQGDGTSGETYVTLCTSNMEETTEWN